MEYRVLLGTRCTSLSTEHKTSKESCRPESFPNSRQCTTCISTRPPGTGIRYLMFSRPGRCCLGSIYINMGYRSDQMACSCCLGMTDDHHSFYSIQIPRIMLPIITNLGDSYEVRGTTRTNSVPRTPRSTALVFFLSQKPRQSPLLDSPTPDICSPFRFLIVWLG